MDIREQLEKSRHTKTGRRDQELEYWIARELMSILAYPTWQKFEDVIRRAMIACEKMGRHPDRHFTYSDNVPMPGNEKQVTRRNYYLSRYACYLISMTGDSSREEIATMKDYFAIQTRKQEIAEELPDGQKRIVLRQRVAKANKQLNGAAKKAGVVNYGYFNNRGYIGMYDRPLRDVKLKKGIPDKEDLLDCSGRAELAAHEFRITQTEQRLNNNNIQGEQNATEAHFHVGREVRNAMAKAGGKMPEDLPREPSIKNLLRKQARDSKRAIENFTGKKDSN